MFTFNSRIATVVSALLIFTLASMGILWQFSLLSVTLLPVSNPVFRAKKIVTSDKQFEGSSTIVLHDQPEGLDFNFTITEAIQYPYISVTMSFVDTGPYDWSRYSTLAFQVACTPNNILSFDLHTQDDKSTLGDFNSYRLSSTHFTCAETTRDVAIDLRTLEIPEWWRRSHHVDLSDRAYQLDKVLSFAIVSASQSPRNTPSSVNISHLKLKGREWLYLHIGIVLNVSIWLISLAWYLRYRSQILIAEVKQRIQQDCLLIAYQQLPQQHAKDEHRDTIMRYIATEYSNADLSVELMVSALDVSRQKINEILKSETGLSFSAYLNKLRLTEAARLLVEKNASAAEIAYAVGYNNVSYFTTLFKKEYGYSPKSFKKHMLDTPH